MSKWLYNSSRNLIINLDHARVVMPTLDDCLRPIILFCLDGNDENYIQFDSIEERDATFKKLMKALGAETD